MSTPSSESKRTSSRRPPRQTPVLDLQSTEEIPRPVIPSSNSDEYLTCGGESDPEPTLAYESQAPLLGREPEPEGFEYPVFRYRWVTLFCIFLLNSANSALWLTYSPISDIVAEKYNVAESVVNILSLCLSGLYGPVVWCAAPLVQRLGLAHSVRLAGLLTVCGAIVRALGTSPSTFGLVIAGQCLSGVARPVISQLLGLTSLNWFPKEKRQLATAIAALGNPFGVAIGFMLSPAVTQKDPDKVVDLNYITAAGSLVVFIFVCLFVRERPLEDPSVAAMEARNRPVGGKGNGFFATDMKHLKNKQYMFLAITFGIAFGQCNAIAVILNQMLKPFGYEHAAVGATGVMTIVPGVIGAMFISQFLGKQVAKYSDIKSRGEEPTYGFLYRETLMIIYIMGGICMSAINWLAMRSDLPQFNPWLLGSAGIFGFFAQPAFAVGLETASECVYPCGPSTAGAGIIMCAQYVGLAVSAGAGYYIDQGGHDSLKRDRVHEVGVLMSSCWLIAGCLMYFYKGKDNLRRLIHETEEEQRRRRIDPSLAAAPGSPGALTP